MSDIEKRMYEILIIGAVTAAIISMVAGPVGNAITAIATAASAIVVGAVLVFYGLYFWRGNDR